MIAWASLNFSERLDLIGLIVAVTFPFFGAVLAVKLQARRYDREEELELFDFIYERIRGQSWTTFALGSRNYRIAERLVEQGKFVRGNVNLIGHVEYRPANPLP